MVMVCRYAPVCLLENMNMVKQVARCALCTRGTKFRLKVPEGMSSGSGSRTWFRLPKEEYFSYAEASFSYRAEGTLGIRCLKSS